MKRPAVSDAMPSEPVRKHVRYDDLHFEVRSPSAAHLEWIEDFLAPHFTTGIGSGRPIRVALAVDPARHARGLSGASGGEEVPVFAYDSQVLHLPCSRGRNGTRVLYEAPYDAVYEVSEDRHEVAITIATDGLAIRTPLMRIVREYAMNHAHAAGDFFLHASCFVTRGRAVLITGPKNAGKTSLLVFACRSGQVRYLSNDRVRVQARNGSYRLRGMPVIINIRAGTLDFFPRVRERIVRGGLHHRLRGGERPDSSDLGRRAGDEGSFGLTTSQFCRVVDTPPIAEAEQPMVVIPRITRRPGTFAIRRLAPEEAWAVLQDSLFGARYWATSTPVFNLSPEQAPDRAAVREKCRRFAAEVPVFQTEVGTDLYHSEGGSQPWIEALLRSGGAGD